MAVAAPLRSPGTARTHYSVTIATRDGTSESMAAVAHPRRTGPRHAATDGAGGLRAVLRPGGYQGTTISAVATAAGVAVPTVYYTFGTKAALLGEALGAAIVGFDRWREPPAAPIDIAELLTWHAWWAELRRGADRRPGPRPLRHPRGRRPRARRPRCRGAARRRRRPRGRRGGPASPRSAGSTPTATAVRIIARKPGGLRRSVTEATATDIVVALFSAELYQALAVGRGWSRPAASAFFREILDRAAARRGTP